MFNVLKLVVKSMKLVTIYFLRLALFNHFQLTMSFRRQSVPEKTMQSIVVLEGADTNTYKFSSTIMETTKKKVKHLLHFIQQKWWGISSRVRYEPFSNYLSATWIQHTSTKRRDSTRAHKSTRRRLNGIPSVAFTPRQRELNVISRSEVLIGVLWRDGEAPHCVANTETRRLGEAKAYSLINN